MIKKNAQGLPINMLVMLILGVIIFALGLGLFSKFNESGDEQLDKLQNKIRTGIASVECDDGDWICSPSYKIRNGQQETFLLYLVNNDDSAKKYKVVFAGDGANNNQFSITNDECGEIDISYLINHEVNMAGGTGAQIPFIVKANKVRKSGCSFVTSAQLKDLSGNVVGKTPVIIRIE